MITPDEARTLTIANPDVVQELDEINERIAQASMDGLVKMVAQLSGAARMFLTRNGYDVQRNHGSEPIDYTISWS